MAYSLGFDWGSDEALRKKRDEMLREVFRGPAKINAEKPVAVVVKPPLWVPKVDEWVVFGNNGRAYVHKVSSVHKDEVEPNESFVIVVVPGENPLPVSFHGLKPWIPVSCEAVFVLPSAVVAGPATTPYLGELHALRNMYVRVMRELPGQLFELEDCRSHRVAHPCHVRLADMAPYREP